ncbi:hypothetical protein AALP_AA7G044600 [Arabis alpina]|uniref:Uncharacterized protein n=1 Tax=Arabis alpina TaxID=50452 RepID=A0A087GFW9_ARAAL|nr:hypothetical protein AALP_AA7G044600 [Arabis alpina]
MGLSKGKKNLSLIFRNAMRSVGKSPVTITESEVGDSLHTEVLSTCLVDHIKHLAAPSITELETNEEEGTSSLHRMVNNMFSTTKTPTRGRNQADSFKKKQSECLSNLTNSSARKLGAETMLDVLSKMGKEAGEKEYNITIKLCIQQARRSNDAEYAFDRMAKAVDLFKQMRRLKFSIKEGVYGPFLTYLVDMEMVDEFRMFKDFIREASPGSDGKLAYYEMLLWIQVGDEEKIHELCNTIDDSGISLSVLQESYLVALCENDRKENLQKLLEVVDITKISSRDVLKSIFGYLGKSLLESVALKLLWELRESGKDGVEPVSDLISSYATSIPNPMVGDAILKFNKMHKELDVVPSSTSYEKLVSYLCGSNEVVTALDVVENMCEAGLVISENILHSLLHAIEQILEFNLVQRIYSIMSNKSVKPNSETFKRMISLCTRIKDFEGAYDMLGSLKNFNLAPTTSMFNSILAGYFREKKMDRALMVLKEMKEADVKPDSVTYSYLINYCGQEEAIAEYYEEMKQAGLQANKQVYMSLIKSYASCGQFEKAKQVLKLPSKDLENELKSVLIYALASKGKIADALSIYEEMKKDGCTVEPKSIISLIDNSDPNEDLITLAQLANELHDYKHWIDGFFKIILFAVRNNNSSSILDLLEEAKNYLSKDDIAVEYWFEEVFRSIAETKCSNVNLGLDLVSFMKEELGLSPSRKCLDFLLHACVNAKDKQNALVVWKEYQFAELPYNVLNYLRMYQVLVAAGDSKSAKAMVSKIPSDDKDVKCIIKESHTVFTPKPKKKKSKKKTKLSPDKVG